MPTVLNRFLIKKKINYVLKLDCKQTMCHHELGAYNSSLIYEFKMLFVHFSSDVFGCVWFYLLTKE